ncbi:MAG: hypothetical protein AB4062_00590 [Crocosphaera sp.]
MKPVRSELQKYLLQNYMKLHKNGIKNHHFNLILIQDLSQAINLAIALL